MMTGKTRTHWRLWCLATFIFWRFVSGIVVIGLFSLGSNAIGDDSRPTWISQLPTEVRQTILWYAVHEQGDLSEWEPTDCEYPGGGVLNTREDQVTARATSTQAHSGCFSAEATIRGAIRAEDGKRAVRLMRWTERPWDKGGSFFPKAAYYSTWMFFPTTYNCNKYPTWDPGDGGWWNVFQFKTNDENDASQPVWSLNVYHDDALATMYFGLYSQCNTPAAIGQRDPVFLPVGKWFHVEVFYRTSSESKGQIIVWQDGKEILRGDNVRTAVSAKNENAVWGIGSYTDHIAGGSTVGTSTIFFDDAAVSTCRLSAHLNP